MKAAPIYRVLLLLLLVVLSWAIVILLVRWLLG